MMKIIVKLILLLLVFLVLFFTPLQGGVQDTRLMHTSSDLVNRCHNIPNMSIATFIGY